MKGMRKISRGSSFSGVMAYAFDGDLEDPRELKGEVIGGNMIARDPKGLAREFEDSLAIRPDVKKPVWHNSLRLIKDEKISNEKWDEIGEDYMKQMGFTDSHQRVYMLHDDDEGQHIHIVASRIGLDGELFLGKNENLKSTKIIADLEIKYGLNITKGVNYQGDGKTIAMPDKSKPSKAEMEKALRTEKEPARAQLQKLIDLAIIDSPSVTLFVERLQASGVDVVPNIASTGRLNGFSFGLLDGDDVYFSGSKLGDQYKQQSLEKRGLTYDKDRESSFLRELKARASNDGEHDRNAEGPSQPRSGQDREDHYPGSRDRSSVRGSDGQGVDSREQGTHGLDSASDGRDKQSRNGGEFSTESSGQGGTSADQRGESTQADSGATKGRENSDGNASWPGSAGNAGGQSGMPSGGGFDAGVEVTDVGPMHTGDEATDNLLKLAHQGRMKEARDSMARQKRMQSESEAASKKLYAEAQATVNQLLGIGTPKTWMSPRDREMSSQRPYSSKLAAISNRAADATWRDREVAAFSKAIGINGFELAFSDPSKKRGATKKSLTGDQLENPRTVRGLAAHFARAGDVLIRPLDNDTQGVIVLTGLSDSSIEELHATGFAPAAIIEANGKYQVWIKTDEHLTIREREGLSQRLSDVVGVPQMVSNYGRLPGFSKGSHTVSLVSATGEVAPAASAVVNEIRVEIREADATLYLSQMAKARTMIDQDRDIKNIGGIAKLRKGWFLEARDNVQADVMNRNFDFSNEAIETKVLETMARQKVLVRHAYQAVFDESRVRSGSEQYAAERVSQAYARIALEAEGQSVAGVDIEAEARRRFPEIFKRAESGVDSEQKTQHARMKLDGQAEQLEFERKADEQRVKRALEAAMKAGQEKKEGLTNG